MVTGPSTGLVRRPGRPGPLSGVPAGVDAAIGLASGIASGISGRLARTGSLLVAVGRPVVRVAGVLPGVRRPVGWATRTFDDLVVRGRLVRALLAADVDDLLRTVVPAVVVGILDRLDVTALVLQRVDLDRLVAGVDLDAVVERVPIDLVLDRVDLDELASRIDLDAVVERVDIEAVLDRVDIDAIAGRLDIEAVLARVDVNAVAGTVDVEAILDRLDLGALATRVVDEMDLPRIIRESSGAMASETVVGVRMQGIEADERINRVVDRLLLRRRPPPAPLPP